MEAGVLRWESHPCIERKIGSVISDERIRGGNPAKKSRRTGARTKEEEEKDGSPPRAEAGVRFCSTPPKLSGCYAGKLCRLDSDNEGPVVVCSVSSRLPRTSRHSPEPSSPV